MNKLLTLFASVLLLSATLSAQDDPKSKAVLDRLVAKSKSYTSFQADFSSRLQSKQDGLDVKQEGHIKVKGKKFRLELDDNTVINNGTIMWTYSKESNEVMLSDPSEMDQELDPSKLFTQYETGFKSQFVEEKTDGGITVQVIKLFPTDAAKKAYHTIVMTIDKAKVEPKSVKVLYKDGNEVTYTLKKFTPNVELADSLFTFDKAKYPGVEVNDMR